MSHSNRFRITILCENGVGPVSGTLGEHGFAALVESDKESILFDAGQGETLLHNSLRMNKDLHALRRVVLSHGHHDHTGGLWPLLRTCGGKEVLAHPGVFGRRYRVRDTGESLSVGIPYDEAFLRGLGADFNFSERFREIAPNIFLTGEIPRKNPFELGDAGLFCDEAGCTADHVLDDQTLVIRSDRGLVLLLGCCHAGLANTIDHVMEETGSPDIYALIGGTHLAFSGASRIDETISVLHRYRIGKICACHCTGFNVSARLLKEFPGRFHPGQVGHVLEV